MLLRIHPELLCAHCRVAAHVQVLAVLAGGADDVAQHQREARVLGGAVWREGGLVIAFGSLGESK